MAMRHDKAAGFTLIELMIALVAGAFAVAAVYYLNGVSSRAFSEQMRVSETQMSLRSAMEQLRRDFTRAGYLATPDSNQSPGCAGTTGAAGVSDRRVRAVQIAYDGSNAGDAATLLGAPATNKTRNDAVDLWGNFASADAYLVNPNLTNATSISFQPDSEAFRRSFFDPQPANAAAVFNVARFSQVFAPGRMVRVEHNGRYFYRDIVSRTPGLGTVASPSSVAIASLPDCFEPTAWSAIAPMVHYQYRVESDATADLARLKVPTASAMLGSRRTMLVRREVRDSVALTTVANTSHLLLDYAVEFAVDAVINSAAATARPTWTFSQNGDVTTQSQNGPAAFRSLLVTLTSRSPETDPKLPSMDRATFNTANTFNSPLLMFRVIDPAQASIVMNARVRTLRSEIFLQNM